MDTNEVKKEVLFSNIYGYEDIKKELNLIKRWFENKELLNNPLVALPKAVLFYGRPGCGKTLFVREYSNSFDCPKYIIEGNKANIAEEISSIFKKAKEEEFAIIMIDEIDLLINDNSINLRILQQELDGIDNKGHILVLATTNYIEDLPLALLRDGRFDRRIPVYYPNSDARKIMFTKFLTEFGISLENINIEHIAKVCSNCTCASIKSVCNDVFLRCDSGKATTEDVELSYRRIIDEEYSSKTEVYKDYRVAVHECGHALMAMRFKEDFAFYSTSFKDYGGVTIANAVNENKDTIKKRESNIKISLSGYLAEEIVLGFHDVGSYSDYEKAQDGCVRLVERVCVKGLKHLIPSYSSNDDRYESSKKRKANEKLVDKLLNKYVKDTRKYLKKHKTDIRKMADFMYQNGRLTYKDVESLKVRA